MEVLFYTTHCPQCKVLAKKLEQKKINYTEIEDIATMQSLGLTAVPALSIDGGELLNFRESVKWIDSLEV